MRSLFEKNIFQLEKLGHPKIEANELVIELNIELLLQI